MSQLLIKGHNGARFNLNVTQFRSPMSASITSAQTRKMMHHFPIRAGQPDIQFTVQFRSIDDHHKFRDFAREHQLNTHSVNYNTREGMITLLWPERDIINWTGYITSMPGREVRFEYAPKITFGVSLVDSLLSERTVDYSRGNSFWNVAGPQIPAYILDAFDVESLFQLPTLPTAQVIEEVLGVTQSVAETIINNTVGGVFPQ